jgi:hypothetical protein
MTRQTESPAPVVDDQQECADKKKKAPVPKPRQTPVAYEEVTLTEEAAETLEKARQAAARRPARKIRRMPAGDHPKSDG